MRSLRTRRSLVLGLALVVFASLIPAVASTGISAIPTPLWIVAPAASLLVVRRTATRCDDQPLALLALPLFRAPPASHAVV